jgi:phage gp36-like protein
MMAYATSADLLVRYDRNDVGQLCSDTKNAVSAVDLTTDAVCLAALNDASGDIDGALMVGANYTAADLATLTANSTYKLIRVCCDIAMWYLIQRRPGWNPEKAKAIREIAEQHLERLRKGENTFNIQASIAAGDPVVDGPTMLDLVTGPNALNLIRDRVRNFYPPRFLPGGRN